MHDEICRLLLDNGARLVYTVNRAVGATLKTLEKEYGFSRSETCTNEKIAYELALTGSYASKRTACLFTTDSLYEALDPLMSSAYTGVIGGFLAICVRETEEEVTPLGPFSKLPVIVSDGPQELVNAVAYGYTISERYEIPVIIQVELAEAGGVGRQALSAQRSHVKPDTRKQTGASVFIKNPGRWAATPKFRYELHRALNEKIEKIRSEFECYEGNVVMGKCRQGVITHRRALVEFYEEDMSVLKISTVHPMPEKLVSGFIEEMDQVIVVEGTYPTLQLQIRDRQKVIVQPSFQVKGRKKPEETMYGLKVVRDTLGPASSINMAHGIKRTDPEKKVLAITYEDYFFHSGLPAFVNTLYNNSAYLLLIMANEREEEMKGILRGFGFTNSHHIDAVSQIEHYKDRDDLTVLFCKGII
jgi:TPP-dependent indolepyruvate ferredoxin oxidoreductase alpha subunit